MSFVVVTVILFGAAAIATGRAVAANWRPGWQLVPYALLLAASDRFLLFALFGAELLSPGGYVVASALLLAVAALAFRVTRVRRMVRQYPWLYEAAGPFAWRERRP